MPPSVFTVLLVGTANVTRSALAERLGRAYVSEALGDSAAVVRMLSAGTEAAPGAAMDPDTALVLRGFGGDPSGFTAQRLRDGHVMAADLVLTMTPAHRSEVLTLAPRALARTFTLREAADLVGLVGPPEDGRDAGLADRARALVEEMATARSQREGADDEIPDPAGEPQDVHQEVGEVVVVALLPVLERIVALRNADGQP